MSLSVIIPSRNAANLLRSVGAVLKHEPSAQVLIVDDGVTAESDIERAAIEGWRHKPVFWLRGKSPFIYARNCNIGITATDDEVVLLNDDAILETPGGFSLLARTANEHPEYGLIAPSTNNSGNVRQFRRPGNQLRSEAEMVCFVCVYIPRTTINRVGLLDERFTAYGFDDDDYCRRVRNAGLKIGIHDGCFVDHKSLQPTFRKHATAPGDITAGREIYRAKWSTRQ